MSKFERLLYPTGCSQNNPIIISTLNIKHHPWHLHDEFEIIYVLEGELNISICFYEAEVPAGNFILINRETPHMITADDNNKTISYHFNLNFFEKYIPNLTDYIFAASYELLNSSDMYSDTVISLLEQIASLYIENTKYAGEQIIDQTSALFSLLTGHFSQWQQSGKIITLKTANKKPVQSERLNRILNYIYDNYSEKITLETIAEKEYLSKYYISHLFTEELNMSFKSYLTLARVEIAHYMLISTDYPLTKISEQCGFSSIRSFRQSYIKYTGVTPVETRAKAAGLTIDDMPVLESNLLDSISPEHFIRLLHSSSHITPPDFSDVSEPEVRHIRLNMHKMQKKSKSPYNKTVIVHDIRNMFSHEFENAAELLNRFLFDSITVSGDALQKFKSDFGSFDMLLPVFRILKSYGLVFNIYDATSSLKNEFLSLTSGYSEYAPITFMEVSDSVDKPSITISEKHSPASIIYEAFNTSIAPPCLYPHGDSLYLLHRNNLKSHYFYPFSTLNEMKSNVLMNEPDCIITFDDNDIGIMVINDSSNAIRYLFQLNGMSSNYISCTMTLTDSLSSEISFFPTGIREINDSIRNLVEVKCFPPTEISFISQTPEHHLYVTVKPKTAMYIKLTASRSYGGMLSP